MTTSVFKENRIQKIHPTLIERMEAIVKKVVLRPKFQSDFYINDLKALESCSTFAWYVYDCGTHFIPLHDMEAVRAFQREWISNMKDLTDKKNATDSDRLYVCNVYSGDLRRIYEFKEGNLVDQVKVVV